MSELSADDSEPSIFNEQFGWKHVTTHVCSRKHTDSHEAEQQSIRLDIGSDLQGNFINWLKGSKPSHPCLENGCSSAITEAKVTMRSTPQTLMIFVAPEPLASDSFPMALDLSMFRPKTSLALKALIYLSDDGVYTTAVLKGTRWIKFTRQSEFIEEELDVQDSKPLLVIYKE